MTASLPPIATSLKRSGRSRGAGDADVAAALRASAKLSDGDIKGAVQALVSERSFAPYNQEVLQALSVLHPPIPKDRRPAPQVSAMPFSIDATQMLAALRSFPPGSAAGPDGLRPQHILDMLLVSGPGTLDSALVDFLN